MDFLNLIKISTSASFDNQVPFANEPPNSNPVTSGNFLISFLTNLNDNSAIWFFDFSIVLDGITILETLEIICFILLH